MVKRFVYNESMNCIEEDGKFLSYVTVGNIHCIVGRLNELYEENMDLRELVGLVESDLFEREYVGEIK